MGYQLPILPDSITIAGHTVALGGSQNLAAADLSNTTTGTGEIVLQSAPTISSVTLTGNNALGTVTSGCFDEPLGHTFWSGPTVGQHRLADRVFMGAAVNDTRFDTSPQADWLSQLNITSYGGGQGVLGTGKYSQTYILQDPFATPSSPPNIATPSQALVVGAGTQEAIYGTSVRAQDTYLVNYPQNNPGAGHTIPGWAHYIEAHMLNSWCGNTYCIEMEIRNSNALAVWNPYSTSAGAGSIGLEIGAGAGLSSTGQFDCTAAMYIGANPMAFGSGIMFFPGAIGAHQPGGTKGAIQMPYDNCIQWWNDQSGAAISGQIYCDQFGSIYVEPNGGNLLTAHSIVVGDGYSFSFGTGTSYIGGSSTSSFITSNIGSVEIWRTTSGGIGIGTTSTGVGKLAVNGPEVLLPTTAPSAPGSGWAVYCDSGDSNKLKAIASTGTVVTLGTP